MRLGIAGSNNDPNVTIRVEATLNREFWEDAPHVASQMLVNDVADQLRSLLRPKS